MSQREASYPADGPDFQAIFLSCAGPAACPDPDFTMVAANADRHEATMSTPEQTIGKPLFESFPDNPDDPETEGVRNLTASLERVKATLQPDTMAVQKYDILLPDGSGFEERYWSPVNTPVVVDGKLRYIIHAVTDVTEFIRSQREGSEQAELARELLDENAQMAADILHRQQQVANASRQLKELDRAKTAFFANVSHELRTLLALILGRTDALESQINPLDEQAYAHIDSIRANAQVLLNQVNHPLSAAKMDVGTPTLEWRDVDMGQPSGGLAATSIRHSSTATSGLRSRYRTGQFRSRAIRVASWRCWGTCCRTPRSSPPGGESFDALTPARRSRLRLPTVVAEFPSNCGRLYLNDSGKATAVPIDCSAGRGWPVKRPRCCAIASRPDRGRIGSGGERSSGLSCLRAPPMEPPSVRARARSRQRSLRRRPQRRNVGMLKRRP